MKILKIRFLKDVKLRTIFLATFKYYGTLSPKSNLIATSKENEELDLILICKDPYSLLSYFYTENFVLVVPEDSFEILQKLTEEEYFNLSENKQP